MTNLTKNRSSYTLRGPVQHGLHASSFDPINSCRRQSSAQGTRPYAKHLFHIELIFPYDLELVIVCQEGSALPDFPTKAELWYGPACMGAVRRFDRRPY